MPSVFIVPLDSGHFGLDSFFSTVFNVGGDEKRQDKIYCGMPWHLTGRGEGQEITHKKNVFLQCTFHLSQPTTQDNARKLRASSAAFTFPDLSITLFSCSLSWNSNWKLKLKQDNS